MAGVGSEGLCQDTECIAGPTHPSRKISTNFPKRLELSFLTVLALPKDSRRGVASRIWAPEENADIFLVVSREEHDGAVQVFPDTDRPRTPL